MLKGAGGASGLLKGAGVLAAAGMLAPPTFLSLRRIQGTRPGPCLRTMGTASRWTTNAAHEGETRLSCQLPEPEPELPRRTRAHGCHAASGSDTCLRKLGGTQLNEVVPLLHHQ